MTTPTVAVTGGAEFVGSRTCKALAKAGFLPVVYDDLSNDVQDAVRWEPLHVGALEEEALLAAVVTRYEPVAVVHFAAFIEVGESVREPERFYRNNVGGTLALLRVMRDACVDKLVFSSIIVVYGNPEVTPIPESHPLRPVNSYGRSKLTVEAILADLAVAHGLRYAALRYFNAAGADPDGELGENHRLETHLILLVLQAAYGQRPHIAVFGSFAEAHALALCRLIGGGESLTANLGTGRDFSVREVVKAVQVVIGLPIKAVPAPRRPGVPAILVADASAARRELSWRPRHQDLFELVRHAAARLKAHRFRAVNEPHQASTFGMNEN